MGSAAEQARAALAALMGQPDEFSQQLEYTDRSVCRSYLCGPCPVTLVENTKLDAGPCNKVHSDGLREKYQEAVKRGAATYDNEWYRHLKEYIDECDRKVARARKRLEQTQELPEDLMAEGLAVQNMVEVIVNKTDRAEELREEGKLEESSKLFAEIEEHKKVQAVAAAEFKSKLPSGNLQQQSLRVCDTCSCMLSIVDNDERLVDHFKGRQHAGMQEIRKLAKAAEESARQQRDRPRDRERERSRDRGDRRDRDRNRDKDRDRSRRDGHRDRDRRDRDRDNRDRRSRDDRDRRSRDRDRDRK
eukprot:m.333381 g.333381  ORF g.333381 m.333381 type:complete len:303 (-) comp17135_c0_seq1:786-1694(-)